MAECEQYWILISSALDGTLTREEEARLNAHLLQCPDCRAMLEELQAVRPELAAVEPPSDGFTDRVMAACAETPQDIPFTALEQNRNPNKFARERMHTALRPLRTIGALAACCLLIFGVSRFALGGCGSAAPAAAEVTDAAGEVPEEAAAEESAMNFAESGVDAFAAEEADTAPALELDGMWCFYAYEVTVELPDGFTVCGTLTAEQSAAMEGETGYTGDEYYTAEDDPGVIWIRGENGGETAYLLWTCE